MAIDIIIPEMGESVTSGVVAAWKKNDGEFVNRDEPVLELETDKITLEVPSPAAGVLRHGAAVGQTVAVRGVVGQVDDKAAPPATAKPAATPVPSSNSAGAGAATATTPPALADDDIRATPLARKLAQERGIDLNSITGTGAGGRIREQDVMGAQPAPQTTARTQAAPATSLTTAAPASSPAQPRPPQPAPPTSRREKMSPLRQRVAARLVEAQHAAAMLTTFNECDMSAVMALRAQHKEAFEKKHGVGLGFMSFFIKAVVNALRAFPTVNASIVSSPAGEMEIEHHGTQDIAIAVGTPKGLVVPVLRDCASLSFAQIEAGVKDLGTRARDGKLGLADLQGGTFTITNGGIYGSLMSTPILNPPQTGILGMHAIKPRAVEYPAGSGQVAIRPMMYLALSYDHRLIDGSEAVQFLVSVKNGIEAPERLMLGL